MIYFDSAYVAKCYLPEHGHREVLALAEEAGAVACSLLARIEVATVFHRKLRENELTRPEFRELHAQFAQDCSMGVWEFLPLTAALVETAARWFSKAPPAVFLRSVDCLHLCAAVEGGFTEVYSNDRHLLAAAPHFGLRAINVIPPVA